MSCFRAWFARVRRAGLLGAVVLSALASASCGFQPLYGKSGGRALSAQDRLGTVRVLPLPDRVGQQMHNLLRNRLNPGGQPVKPDYNLQIQVSEALRELSIRKDETATRANLTVTADFVLRDARTNQELVRGRSRSINSYNILDSQFATLFSESDARKRGLREISIDIHDRLAVYFAALGPSES